MKAPAAKIRNRFLRPKEVLRLLLPRIVPFGFTLTILSMLLLGALSLITLRTIVANKQLVLSDHSQTLIQTQDLQQFATQMLTLAASAESKQYVPPGWIQLLHRTFVEKATEIDRTIQTDEGHALMSNVLKNEAELYRLLQPPRKTGLDLRLRTSSGLFDALGKLLDHKRRVLEEVHVRINENDNFSELLVLFTMLLSIAETIAVAFLARRAFGKIERVEKQRAESTELERIARAERDNEQAKLNSVFMDAPALIAIHRGPQHRFEMVNTLYQASLGDREVIGRPFDEVFGSTIGNTSKESRDQVFRSGKPLFLKEVRFENTTSPSDLEEFFLDMAYLPLFDAGGRVDGIIVYGQDVTEKVLARKRIEKLADDYRFAMEKTNSAERRLRSLLNNLPLVLWAVNRDLVLTSMEGKGLLDLGIDPNQMIGKPYVSILGAPISSLETIKRALGGETIVATDQYAGRWFESHYSPIESLEGEIVGVVGMSFDITEQKRVSEALEQSQIESRAVQETSRLKSEFLAHMSHEIRTPLNAIIGMTELLLDGHLEDQQRRYVHITQDSGTGLLAIINDILDFSKIEAGKLDLEILDFNMVSVVEGQAELLMARAREKDLSLITFVDPELPEFLRGDSGRIGQILLNLLGNAIKFTARGSIILKAWQLREEEHQHWIRFEVRDTGIGISDEEQSRLFQPFSQADASTARKFGGTGLGLSICKRLVSRMAGSIGVESAPNRGSVFWFEIPLDRAKRASAAPVRSLQSLKPDQQIKILLADPDPISQEIVNTYLTRWGVVSECTTSTARIADVVSGEPCFDILLIEEGLLIADRKLLNLLQGQNNQKVILMNNVGSEIRKTWNGAHITKPLRQIELYEKIVEVIAPNAKKATPALDPDRPDDVSTPQAPKGHILVAEDNAVNQLLTLTLLKKMGHSAQAVANGKEAVEAFISGGFDLVLMDCQMPELDGYDATKKIREYETRSGGRVPIIALTANAMKEDEVKCLACGMDSFVSKPVKKNQLAAIVDYWLNYSGEQKVA